MAEPATYFCDDAAEARDRFLDLCTRTGLTVGSIPSRSTGFSCDFTRLGAPSATHLLVLASGAGGVAGFVHAGLCSALLGEQLQRHLGRNVAIVLVHAVNPKGPAWPAPGANRADLPNADDADDGAVWSDALLNAADARFRAHIRARDQSEAKEEAEAANSQTAWTADNAAVIARDQLQDARFALLLDFRTGLGGWADPTILNTAPPSDAAHARARRWYPSAVSGPLHTPGAPQGAGLAAFLSETQHVAATVEFGTFRQAAALGRLTSSGAGFDPYPKSRDWRTRVWNHSERIILQAISACEEMIAAERPARKSSAPS